MRAWGYALSIVIPTFCSISMCIGPIAAALIVHKTPSSDFCKRKSVYRDRHCRRPPPAPRSKAITSLEESNSTSRSFSSAIATLRLSKLFHLYTRASALYTYVLSPIPALDKTTRPRILVSCSLFKVCLLGVGQEAICRRLTGPGSSYHIASFLLSSPRSSIINCQNLLPSLYRLQTQHYCIKDSSLIIKSCRAIGGLRKNDRHTYEGHWSRRCECKSRRRLIQDHDGPRL